MNECIFCQIVDGTAPSHKVWEDGSHLAFLSIFPNTEGTTVVIPKAHRGSYLVDQEDEVITDLMFAVKQVAKLLDASFYDVGRTGIIFEGFGVDHLHAKLYPMHETKGAWKKRNSAMDKYFTEYEGYLSSHDAARMDDEKLAGLAKRLRG